MYFICYKSKSNSHRRLWCNSLPHWYKNLLKETAYECKLIFYPERKWERGKKNEKVFSKGKVFIIDLSSKLGKCLTYAPKIIVPLCKDAQNLIERLDVIWSKIGAPTYFHIRPYCTENSSTFKIFQQKFVFIRKAQK